MRLMLDRDPALFQRSDLPRLWWLPTSEAEVHAGLPPVYGRLERAGRPFEDESGFLTPDLEWTSRGFGDDLFPVLRSAYQLLQSTANIWNSTVGQSASPASFESLPKWSTGSLSPGEILAVFPRVEGTNAAHMSLWSIFSSSSSGLPMTLRRQDWLNWLQAPDVQRRLHQRQLDTPYRAIREGFRQLSSTVKNFGPDGGAWLSGLALMTLGLLGVMPRVRCELCFRLAAPQRLRCLVHLQTGTVRHSDSSLAGLRSALSANARLGRKVSERLKWDTFEPTYACGAMNNVAIHTLGGLIWGYPSGTIRSANLRTAISNSVAAYGELAELLPSRIRGASLPRQLSMLRRWLDPFEFMHDFWPDKLGHAYEWLLACNEITSPGGMKPRNAFKFNSAKLLLKNGMRKSDVAEYLDISRSQLSDWLRRRGE